MLVCDYCGDGEIIKGKEVERHRVSQLGQESTVDLITKSFVCGRCGSENLVSGKATSVKCSYCSSPYVDDLSNEIYVPDAIVPFTLDENQIGDIFGKWVRRRFWAPNDFKKLCRKENLTPSYLPFWSFDMFSKYRYVVRCGTDHYKKNSKGESVYSHTTWVTRHGYSDKVFSNLCVSDSSKIGYFLNKLESDFNDYVGYDPRYLCSFGAEKFNQGLEKKLVEAKRKAVETIKSDVKSNEGLGYDKIVIDSLNVDFNNEFYKYVLFPIWLVHYSYKNENYDVVVNGHTGQIEGASPISWIKVLIAVILFSIIIVLVLNAS